CFSNYFPNCWSVDEGCVESATGGPDWCDAWLGACDGRGPAWYSGAEVTFLGSGTRRGGTALVSVEDTGLEEELGVISEDGLGNFVYGPRLWLGRYHDNWGIVGRFWYLNGDDASGSPFVVPN